MNSGTDPGHVDGSHAPPPYAGIPAGRPRESSLGITEGTSYAGTGHWRRLRRMAIPDPAPGAVPETGP
ncbi:hypothetical protein GCM10009665_80220 [Kitasatospora nipponensis]|uniref:Uncharacterized protein n=1 Tax=Kitasatospora nipponensis TaxID=258049 RepID=A0ABP4DYR4_9ACTN